MAPNATLHSFEELLWRTLCAQKQIVGNTGSRVAKETLYGFEELPWRTLCARKQLVEIVVGAAAPQPPGQNP